MTNENPKTTIDLISEDAVGRVNHRRYGEVIEDGKRVDGWDREARRKLRSVADVLCDGLELVAEADQHLRIAAGYEGFSDEDFADKAAHWALAVNQALDNASSEMLAAIQLLPDDFGFLPRREEPQKLRVADAGRLTCPKCGRQHDLDKSTEAIDCECGFRIRFTPPDDADGVVGCHPSIPVELTVWDRMKAMSASVQRHTDGRWIASGHWVRADTSRSGNSPEEAIEALWSHWRDAGSPEWGFAARG